MDKTIKTMMEAIKMSNDGTKPYDTVAEVVRVEGNTAWCHIVGGIDETPVQMTISAQSGDTVQVRVSGGRAWITGNLSAPPTDDTVAKAARQKAEVAEATAEEANVLSSEAKKQAAAAAEVAADTEQHFWFTETGTDTGAHITEKTQEDFLDDPTNGGGNLLARSNGIALRDGLIELATLQQSGLNVNTYDSNGDVVNIAHLGYGDANGGTSPYYIFGDEMTAAEVPAYDGTVGYYGGDIVSYNGKIYMAWNYISAGISPPGYFWQLCPGRYSHVEGVNCLVSDMGGHAEGRGTRVSGAAGHAEGLDTVADGGYSHAQNRGTVAASNDQTALGRFNIRDMSTLYAVIIGNGTSSARSNALTVDWSGEVRLYTDSTEDADLLQAISDLGWTSDVIE